MAAEPVSSEGPEDFPSVPWAPSELPGAVQLSKCVANIKSSLLFSCAGGSGLRTLSVDDSQEGVTLSQPPSSILHSLGTFLVVRKKRSEIWPRSLTEDNQPPNKTNKTKHNKQKQYPQGCLEFV